MDTSGPKSLPLVAGSSEESVKLEVHGRSDADITSALDKIEKFIQNRLKSKRKEHPRLMDVVLKHWDEIKQLANDNDLRITCDEKTVLIEGLFSKVVEANDKLTELIGQQTGQYALFFFLLLFIISFSIT